MKKYAFLNVLAGIKGDFNTSTVLCIQDSAYGYSADIEEHNSLDCSNSSEFN
jgi:hypothetical protein